MTDPGTDVEVIAAPTPSRLLSGMSPPPDAFKLDTASRKTAASAVNCPPLNRTTSTFSPGLVMS